MTKALIDTHTHLDTFVRHGTLAETLERARVAGVGEMIVIGTASDDWSVYRDIARDRRGCVHYTVGLHPCSVGENWADEVAQIEAFWNGDPRPVALGECGLDRFHLPKDDAMSAARIFGWQREAFAAQLDIVKRRGCPLVVHSRGAFAESVSMIDASGVDWAKVVYHCFTEGPAEMSELLQRGGRGSFTGVLTYKNADGVREAARVQGLDRLMLETDAPYLTPMPHRGKPNEPALLTHTADYAAQLFGVTSAELAAATTKTAKAFFGI
jgi:TatD DNase family protein